MILERDIVYEKLLCFGLFPEKLSEIFTSEEFGKWVLNNEENVTISKNNAYLLMSYKLTRNNNAQRQMGIPYPFGYLRLCRDIRNNWLKISKDFKKNYYSEKSMVCVKFDNKNKRLVSMAAYDKNPDVEQFRLEKQFGKKYLVRADISSFFPSIYTHTIPWALVGKAKAKKDRFKNVWFAKIDKACQCLQDWETRGLPIGPDTSTILAELILSKVDNKLKKYEYVRFIDDYECSCDSKDDAEKFILDLSKNLEEYKLYLNINKTEIIEYPKAINEYWVRMLRQSIEWKTISKKDKDSVIGFLDLSSELFKINPDESTIRYATQVIKNKQFKDFETYKLVLRYFLNLSFLFPYIIDTCDDLIYRGLLTFKSKETEIKDSLQVAFKKILEEHSKNRRSDALTWCLFLVIKFGLTINNFNKIEKDILRTKDPIPILMCYLYNKIIKNDVSKYIKLISDVDDSEWWLFVYEVSRIEGLRLDNDNMERIRKDNISFISKSLGVTL